MARVATTGTGRVTMFGGKKGQAQPRKGTVSDTNTRQMAMSTWTPRHLRVAR